MLVLVLQVRVRARSTPPRTGVQEPPVLSVEMLNPVDEQRPLAQLVICCARRVGSSSGVGGAAGVVVAVRWVVCICRPPSPCWAHRRARSTPSTPMALTRIIRGLGRLLRAHSGRHRVLRVSRCCCCIDSDLPESLQVGFILFCVLSIFALLGGALFERRHVLGLEPTHSPERSAEREDRERSRERAKALDVVYGEARGGNFMAARDSLLHWMRSRRSATGSSVTCGSSSPRRAPGRTRRHSSSCRVS